MFAHSIGNPLLWAGFLVFVLAMLALDLGVFNRKVHVISFKESLVWSVVWVVIAGIFAAGVYRFFGKQAGLEFVTGYVIERALSVDNLFVFLVIFQYFAVKQELQHRVLFWGILGALVMRAIFILAGGAILEAVSWAIYVFGGILVVTGVKLFVQRNEETHPERNPVVRLIAKVLPLDPNYHGRHFVKRLDGRLVFTPLFLALVTVEISDVVFAVDSIPAVFAVTRDPFIVFTSNIFAILGLRAMYFMLAGIMDSFRFLRIGLAAVLVFVGVKMLVAEFVHIPIGLSLGAVGGLIGLSILASVVIPKPVPKS
jgi:tellurite resistance protein TerC